MAADYYPQTVYSATSIIGNPVLAVRKDTAADLAGTNSCIAPPQMDDFGALRVTEDGGAPTYTASFQAIVPVASATDVFMLAGSTTKVVKVHRVRISITGGAAKSISLGAHRRNTAAVNGTFTTATATPHDSTNNATATASFRAYTTNPTLGTSIGIVRSDRYTVPVTDTGASPTNLEWDFRGRDGAQTVRMPTNATAGTEAFVINFNASTIGTGLADCTIEWSEHPVTA